MIGYTTGPSLIAARKGYAGTALLICVEPEPSRDEAAVFGTKRRLEDSIISSVRLRSITFSGLLSADQMSMLAIVLFRRNMISPAYTGASLRSGPGFLRRIMSLGSNLGLIEYETSMPACICRSISH